jgi:hypothetical protein
MKLETREDILNRAIGTRRLRKLSAQQKHFCVFEDGVCVFDCDAYTSQQAELMYRERFGVTGDGNYFVKQM